MRFRPLRLRGKAGSNDRFYFTTYLRCELVPATNEFGTAVTTINICTMPTAQMHDLSRFGYSHKREFRRHRSNSDRSGIDDGTSRRMAQICVVLYYELQESRVTPKATIRALAQHVKAAVFPHLGTWRAHRVTGIAASGDATFDIDEIAETAVEQFIYDHALNVAYYSEDRGLIRPFPDREPEGVLIIDPTLKDVRYGGITEIKGGLTFSAERGGGIEIVDLNGNQVAVNLSPTTEIEQMAWTLEAVGAPVEMVFESIKDLVNATTVRGGLFILNSSAFELTRLVIGQLSGVVDVRNRIVKDYPETRPLFVRHGGGRMLSLYGYDMAAAALILTEAGGVMTDAWGRSLDDWKLLDTTEPNFGSLIAASNALLHAKLVEEIDRGFSIFAPRF